MIKPNYPTFLFTYRFEGKEWGFDIKAANAAEARERVKQLSLARYDGQLMYTIPAGGGWLAKIMVSVRNYFYGAR